jgi:hypothetical protein
VKLIAPADPRWLSTLDAMTAIGGNGVSITREGDVAGLFRPAVVEV